MADHTNFDRIEAYLLGRMSAEEARHLEQEAAQDTALAAELQQQTLEHRAMELLVQDDLRAHLNTWKSEKTAEQPTALAPRATRVSLFYRIAAAATVTLVLGFFARSLFLGNSAESLALRSLDESGLSARSGGQESTLEPVYATKERGDYRAALQLLDQLPPSEQTRQTGALLRGECYLHLKDYPAAVSVLQGLLSNQPADDLREKAEWLLLVTYVAEGKHAAEADALFAKILGDDGHPYADDARRLKEAIRR